VGLFGAAHLAAGWGGLGAVAIGADSRYLVAGRNNGELKVWELATRRLVTTLEGRRSQGRSLAITPDNRYVVSGGADGSLDLWDIGEAATDPPEVPWQRRLGGLAREFWSGVRQQAWREIGYVDSDSATAITADGGAAVLWSGGGGVVWNLASGRNLYSWSEYENLKTAVAVTADRRYVLLGENDGHLRIWRSWWGEVVKLAAHTSRISAIGVTPDGRLAVSASWDKTLKVWELRYGQLKHGQPVSSIEGQGFFDKVATHLLWWGRKVLTLTGHEGWVNAVAVLPDGRHAVSASSDRTLKVWSLVSGTEVRTLSGHDGSVAAVAVTPDGRYVISGSSDRTVRLWDVATGLEVSRYEKHTQGVTAVAITPDGRYAVSGGQDGMVRIWELTSGFEVAMFPAADAVQACAVDRDGRIICQDEAWRLYILQISGALPA
jgi:WD40 repeat protein